MKCFGRNIFVKNFESLAGLGLDCAFRSSSVLESLSILVVRALQIDVFIASERSRIKVRVHDCLVIYKSLDLDFFFYYFSFQLAQVLLGDTVAKAVCRHEMRAKISSAVSSVVTAGGKG